MIRLSALERAPAAALLLVAVGFFVIAGICADIALERHRLAEAMTAVTTEVDAAERQVIVAARRDFDDALNLARRQSALEFASYAVAAAVAGLVFFPWRVFRTQLTRPDH